MNKTIRIGVPDDYETNFPMPLVEELHVYRSKRDNGYEVEARIFGHSLGGLRVETLTLGGLAYCIQQYAKTAWAANRDNIEVANFQMTVERGGNNAA